MPSFQFVFGLKEEGLVWISSFKNRWRDLGKLPHFVRRVLAIFNLRRLRFTESQIITLPTTTSSPLLSSHGIRMNKNPTARSRTTQVASRGCNFGAVAPLIDAQYRYWTIWSIDAGTSTDTHHHCMIGFLPSSVSFALNLVHSTIWIWNGRRGREFDELFSGSTLS